MLITTLMLSGLPAAPVAFAAAVDFTAFPVLEITQGVQNMQTVSSGKSVPLVAGRRTYVIFYATSNFATTTAVLTVERNGKTITVKPINSTAEIGPILPTRTQGGIGRFVFELPSSQLSGSIKLKATINPNKNMPASETVFSNNSSTETTVSFRSVAPVTINMYDVQYKRLTGQRVYKLADLQPTDHRALAVNWLYRAYPFSSLSWYNHAIYMGRWANVGGKLNGYCVATNVALYWDGSFGSQEYSYGMVSNTGGYMRGCSEPLHDRTASGPTGNTNGGDGSFGDDYAGHEIGHLFGRDHAAFCGAGVPKSSYPYPNGSISPVETNQVGAPSAVVGYDIISRSTYSYNWRDLMTYCDNRWSSDLSYKRFLDHIDGNSAQALALAPSAAMDRLLLRGMIDPGANQVTIRPSFVLTNSLESKDHQPGPYSFVLRDSSGAELLRYPFTPASTEESAIEQLADPAPQPDGDDAGAPVEPVTPMVFYELVPYQTNTARVDLIGPDNALLSSITAGTTAPTVTVTSGNTITRVPASQQEFTATWEGGDADGDPVYYVLQYSNNDGRTWLQYSDAITETEVVLPQENLMAGTNVQLRVLASDGIHTSVDTNDAPLVVFNHPPTVAILPPISEALAAPASSDTGPLTQTTFAVSQTVTLVADGYDTELGNLDSQLTWSSDQAGVLGQGHTLSTAELGVGQHTITVTADDGAGGTASAQISITVVSTIDDLPALADRLLVDTDVLQLNRTSATSMTVAVHNQNLNTVLSWNATSNQRWLQMSKQSGTTPELVTLELAPNAVLSAGIYTATVTFTSPSLPGYSEPVEVTLVVPTGSPSVYLPLVQR